MALNPTNQLKKKSYKYKQVWRNKHIRRWISAWLVIAKDGHSSEQPVENSKSEVLTWTPRRTVRRACETDCPAHSESLTQNLHFEPAPRWRCGRCCWSSNHTQTSALNKLWDTGWIPQSCRRTWPLRTHRYTDLQHILGEKSQVPKSGLITKC